LHITDQKLTSEKGKFLLKQKTTFPVNYSHMGILLLASPTK
jgi:hypothetical protein